MLLRVRVEVIFALLLNVDSKSKEFSNSMLDSIVFSLIQKISNEIMNIMDEFTYLISVRPMNHHWSISDSISY